MRRFVPPVPREWSCVRTHDRHRVNRHPRAFVRQLLCLATLLLVKGSSAQQAAQQLIADPNVNMVRGVGDFKNGKLDGDPYLHVSPGYDCRNVGRCK